MIERSRLQQIFIAGLASYGLVAAFGISRLHFSGAEECPTIGSLPACYVVVVGYAAMLSSAIRPSKWVFFTGWLPVFMLASIGVGGELFSDIPVCPRTAGGIPKCYFSFVLSAILGMSGWLLLMPKTAPAS